MSLEEMYNMSEKKDNRPKKKITSRQAVALGGVILLAALYLTTLVVAILDRDSSGRLFQACLAGTVFIPLLIWVYIWMYGKLRGKHTMADLDIGGRSKEQEQDSKNDNARRNIRKNNQKNFIYSV